MANFIARLIGRDRSASTAKERLQLVLIHDRTNLPPGVLENLRDEMIRMISQHIEIDASGVVLQMTQDGHEQRLIADIPLKIDRKRRR